MSYKIADKQSSAGRGRGRGRAKPAAPSESPVALVSSGNGNASNNIKPTLKINLKVWFPAAFYFGTTFFHSII